MTASVGADRADTARTLEALSAVALLCVTLVALPGLRGILGHANSLVPAFAVAMVIHAVLSACRWLRIPAGFVIALAGSLVLVGWLALAETTFFGLPTPATMRAAGERLRDAVTVLGQRGDRRVLEGAAVVQGRLVLALSAVAACALMADQAAFRVRSAFLALVPSFSVVLVGATRAPSAQTRLSLVAYMVVALGFVFAHQAMVTRESAATISGRSRLRTTTLVAPAAALTMVAVAAGVLFGPRLPGYGRPALVENQLSAPERQTEPDPVRLSPLVDVNPSLVQQSKLEMFTVASNVPAYWRLVALDDFDGKTWSRSGQSLDADVQHPIGEVVEQEFHIEALRSEWLPAAYQAGAVTGDSNISADDSGSLRTGRPAPSGTRYSVTSVIPRASAGELRQARFSRATRSLRPYLGLPADVSREVLDEATRVSAEARFAGPYERALALQAHFRDNFTYDLNVAPAHDEDALVRFLFKTRRGYCEQFAAAYAVMARAIGLPARVAIGFTPGELEDDGRYHVRGLNAHAWPEVFLEGFGWMAFEPTPGRGMPGAEAYTGVPEQQDRFVPVTPTTVAPGPVTATTAVATPTTVPAPGSPTPAPTVASPAPDRSSLSVPGWVVATCLAVMAGAMVAVGKRERRRRRRARAKDPSERVLVAWTEAAEALAGAGLARQPAETLINHAIRAAGDERLPASVAEPVLVLAGRAGTACYSNHGLDESFVAEADQAATAIESELRRTMSAPRRLALAVDPRPLWANNAVAPPHKRRRRPRKSPEISAVYRTLRKNGE